MNIFNFRSNPRPNYQKIQYSFSSDFLSRDVIYDIYWQKIRYSNHEAHLILMNDGQDGENLELLKTLNKLHDKRALTPLIVVGIHANDNRINEYGTAFSCDYKGRGNKAGLYTKFIMNELIPQLRKELKVEHFKEKSFLGWSLGALSAMDIVWNYPHEFQKAGLFSPSFWWRRKGYENGYQDQKDRLMQLQVKYGRHYPWLEFFFECGAFDETSDRNNNGVIDSIDDCLDIIKELKKLGFKNDQINYVELADGRHDLETWKKVLPLFFEWGFKS